MARTWTVTGPPKTVLANGNGEASFTITNLVASPVRGMIRVLPEGEAKPEMFKLAGETTLDWAPNETKQVTVQINADAVPVGTYVYSAAVVSEQNPSELADRISSSFEVVARKPPPKLPVGIIAAVLGVLVIGGGLLAFFLTRGGLEVPAVEGLTVTEAGTALADAGFVVDVQPADNDDVFNGRVITSDPRQGDRADEGDTVTLSVSTGPPIPLVANESGAEAERILSDAGFTVVVSEVFTNNIPGEVVSTDPVAGERAAPGQAVSLVLTGGPSFTTRVPDVVGEGLNGATAILAQQGLGTFSQCQADPAGQGRVVDQIPDAGTPVNFGADVSLIVTERFCLVSNFDSVIVVEFLENFALPEAEQ